ncbi:MAG: Flp family type IVb pilin [Pirellulales bacterium]
MTLQLKSLNRFLRSEDGPTAVEYAVMLALVVMACIAAVILLGTNTSASFSDSQEKITEAMNNGS